MVFPVARAAARFVTPTEFANCTSFATYQTTPSPADPGPLKGCGFVGNQFSDVVCLRVRTQSTFPPSSGRFRTPCEWRNSLSAVAADCLRLAHISTVVGLCFVVCLTRLS